MKNYFLPLSVRTLICSLIFATASGLLTPSTASAQCVAPPAQPTCAAGIALVDNDNLTVGITRVVTGTSSFNNLTVNGGTLIICGTLNLANLTFTSGNIIVCSGGTLNVNMSAAVVFGANCNLFNYGSVNFASSIVTGSNNLIMNCTLTSTFNITFNQFVLQGPNTLFVNYGTFTSSYFIVQSTNAANPVCSGPGSVIVTGTMINQFANAFTSPSGPSCIQIYSQAINSQPMTLSSNVNICYFGSSAAGLNFGNATVTLNCNSCSVPLPVEDIELQGSCTDGQIQLYWAVESEEDCSVYNVEVSKQGTSFENLHEVTCSGPSTEPVSYYCEINLTPSWHYYTRIKRSHTNGDVTYSPMLELNCLLESNVDIFPTYVLNNEVTIKSTERITAVHMYAMDGRLVKNFDLEPNQKIVVLDVGAETALGQYLLTVETPVIRVDKLIQISH